MSDSPYRVLSLFSGIGGMDMGFGGQVVVHRDSISETSFIQQKHSVPGFVELAPQPFQVVFQNDILTGAKEVCEYNQTAHNFNTTSIYDLLKGNFTFPEADVIIGGFPCQDFSHCGKRRGFKSDKTHNMKDCVNESGDNSRGTLYKCFVEVVKRVKPKVFVAENVYGLLTMKTQPINQIVRDFSELGYDVQYQVVDCTKFGIPQTRVRVLITGISQERTVQQLQPEWDRLHKNHCSCHVGKYLAHLQEPTKTQDISQQLYSKAKRLNKGQGQKEINLLDQAPTIRAEHHGNIEFRRHTDSPLNPSEKALPERRLTLREAGLIQTFPPDYVFTQKKTMRSYKYIGNAVPPLLSYVLADQVHYLLKSYFGS